MVSNPRLRGTDEETTEWEFISLRFSFCLFFTDLFGDVDISLYFCQLIKNVKFHNGQETTDKEETTNKGNSFLLLPYINYLYKINYSTSNLIGPFEFMTSSISSSVFKLKSPGMVFFNEEAVNAKSRQR